MKGAKRVRSERIGHAQKNHCIVLRQLASVLAMKPASYITVLLLAIVCVVLSVALVFTARANQRLQAEVQAKQQVLSSGILGPQGQQIGNSLLQDMANAAARSPGMRKLLENHGYQVQPTETPESATTNENKKSQNEGKKDPGDSR